VDDPVHHIGQDLPAPLCILRVTDNLYFCIFLRPAPQRSICVCSFFRVPSGNISGKSAYSTHKNVLSCSCATPVSNPLSADARTSQVFSALANAAIAAFTAYCFADFCSRSFCLFFYSRLIC
jgi:hypothetical protein